MQIKSRRLRWAVPAAGVAVVAGVTAGSLVSAASAAPQLPRTTPAQLLAAVAGAAKPPPPLIGTVVETARLGLPQLPGADNQDTMTSLLTGSHTIRVYYGGPKQLRLQVPVSMGESDLIRNGSTAYLWQSGSDSVTRYLLPARTHASGPASPLPTATPLTPQQAARRVLAAAGPTTAVSVQRNVYVAGQPAYQLMLRPRSSQSLIGRVSIALDGQHPQVPLRVQVFPRGAHAPAFQIGYTSISFVTPAGANFRFSPPRGAHVHTATPGGAGDTAPDMPAAGKSGAAGLAGGQVIGSHWLSVAVLPASVLSGLSGSASAASVAGQAAQSASSGGASGPSAAALAGALLRSATPVSGPWGHGKLLRTSLLSVLITSNGHVLVGAVTPQALFAAAGHVK